MQDYLVKAICFEGELRAYTVLATETVREAQRRHDTWSASSAALGRTLVASALLGAMLKGDDQLTVKIQGDGLGGAIIVDSNAQGEVKGYIQHPHVRLPQNEQGKIDVRQTVGENGVLSVTKDLGLKEPFTGQVPLVSGELGEDFTYYLANSEQTPSAVGLGVLVDVDESIKAAGGFIVQVLPGASDQTLDLVEKNLANLPAVSTMLADGKMPEQILEMLLGKDHLEILEKMPVQFKCHCSKEKFAKALIAVGPTELDAMINEDHGAEAICHFCGEQYQFSEPDLQAIKAEAEGA